MNTRWALPAVTMAGGLAAFLLRLVQNHTGFESATGLPIPGAPAAVGLAVLLAALCAGLCLLAFRLPPGTPAAFPFPAARRSLLVLPVLGSLILALGGAADLLEGLGILPGLDAGAFVILTTIRGQRMSGGLQAVAGVLSLLGAAGLLSAAAACRPGGPVRPFRNEALLSAPVYLVARLVILYRADSVDPVLARYAVELLALSFLTLGFYALSAFAFHAGQPRRFAAASACGVVFGLCALADGAGYLSSPLVFLGSSAALMGFLLLHLAAAPETE